MWGDIVLDGSLCRSIRIEADDVAEESKSTVSDLGADWRFFGDGVQFLVFDDLRILHIQGILNNLLWKASRLFSKVVVRVQVSELFKRIGCM